MDALRRTRLGGPRRAEAVEKVWDANRPGALVVACSDGRLGPALDAYLAEELGLELFDRLYMPGGPGALASSGYEYLRADHFIRECRFLIGAHQIERLYLVFHAPAPDGPEEAMCADYTRKLPGRSVEELRGQQERDAEELLRRSFGWPEGMEVWALRLEVQSNAEVSLVPLGVREG